MKIIKDVSVIIFFSLILMILINFALGGVAKDKYISLDVISYKTNNASFGYFIPNQQKTIIFPGLKPYQVTVNDLGLRWTGNQQTLQSIQDKHRILCLGDSNTFGLFVDDAASYPLQLQSLFDQNKHNVAILNAGLGGTSIQDVLYYLKVKGLELKPETVVLNFSTNDLYELDRKLLSYEEIMEDQPSKLKGIFEKSNLGRSFRQLYVFYKYKRWMSKVKDSKAKKILEQQTRSMQDLVYVAEHYHSLEALTDPYSEDVKKLWDRYFESLDETVELLKKDNIKIVYYIYPEILSILEKIEKGSYEDILTNRLKKMDVDIINVSQEFRQRREDLENLYNDPPRDFHLGKKGNAIVAQALYDLLKGDLE